MTASGRNLWKGRDFEFFSGDPFLYFVCSVASPYKHMSLRIHGAVSFVKLIHLLFCICVKHVSHPRGKNRLRVFGNKELRRNKKNVQKSHNEKFEICRFTRCC